VNGLTQVNVVSTTETSPDPADQVLVKDLETLRVLSDPLRMRMVDLMSRGEWTAKALASELGVGQTRLYHHLARLEDHGLVRVTGTRLVSGITEKSYTATSSRIRIDPSLFTAGSPAPSEVALTLDGLVGAAFDTVRKEIELSIEAGAIDPGAHSEGPHRLTISHDSARLTPTEAEAFQARIEALVREFSAAGEGAAGEAATHRAEPYRLLVAFYRAASPAHDSEAGIER
jgi:DNA-binding transcriptional ArsR family regulator